MEIAQVVLDYIKTLVWPAVAVTGVLVFRQPIRSLIAEGRTKLKGPGFEIQAEAATFALNSRVAAAAQKLTRSASEHRRTNVEERRAAADESVVEVEAAEESARRQAVEVLLADAATWGWQMAQLGWSQRPVLDVRWDEDGRVRMDTPSTPAARN